jgi:hypothetical protein
MLGNPEWNPETESLKSTWGTLAFASCTWRPRIMAISYAVSVDVISLRKEI